MFVTTINNLRFEAAPSKSILSSAMDHGIVFQYSCKNGQCGVCKTTLLEGEVTVIQAQLGLTEEERKKKKILTCCCAPASDIFIDAEDLTALKGIKVKTLPVRISQLKLFSSHILEVTLRFPPSADFEFLEGQYLDVIWKGIRRSYSIASSSTEQDVTLLVKKVRDGQMSDYWFNQANENDLLRIEGPKGTFFLRNQNAHLVLLATGTGIAPIIAMLKKMDEAKDFHQINPIRLYWGNRQQSDFIWSPEFKELKVDVEYVLSGNDKDWHGKKGYVQDVALTEVKGLQHTDVYACGSNNMILSAKQLFIEAGLEEKNFFSDAFVENH